MSPDVPTPDFDLMMSLHQHDPEAFEAFRRHLLRNAVDAAPLAQRPNLERLLRRIDAARNAAATPADAMLAAFRMMQDSIGELRFHWEQAHEAFAGLQAALLMARLRR